MDFIDDGRFRTHPRRTRYDWELVLQQLGVIYRPYLDDVDRERIHNQLVNRLEGERHD